MDLTRIGMKKVVGIDFCQAVVEFMEARKRSKGMEDIKYEHMDCRGELTRGHCN